MNGAFYIGATGLQSQQRALDVIANNIANMNTAGFKRSRVRFSELVSPGAGLEGVPLPPSADGLAGVRTSDPERVFVQGDLRVTSQPLDLAVDGDGFLELLGPGGRIVLWRGGSMAVNADGYLSGPDGMPLRALIKAPDDTADLRIDREGIVRSASDGDANLVEIGRLDLVDVTDPEALTPLGDSLYAIEDPTNLSSVMPTAETAQFVQGALEGSNVQLTDEMVQLLLTQRAYAASAQLIQAGDQLMAIANGLRR